MHACLLHIYDHAFTSFVIVVYHEDRSRPCVRAIFIQIKTGLLSCLRHLFGYVTFLHFKAPNGFSLLADSSL
jgi:hypothetical protein